MRTGRVPQLRLIRKAVIWLAVGLVAGGCTTTRPIASDRTAGPQGHGEVATPRSAAVTEATPARPEVVSLLGAPLYRMAPGPERAAHEQRLQEARKRLEEDPDDPQRLIWVGRRLAYLWRIDDALAVYTEALARFPDNPELYRHRGHRLITARRFAEAEADLERATQLIAGRPDPIEPDGLPNARNIPLTTTAFNIWYHLGLARYLQGDFRGAADAFGRTMAYTRGYDDNIVAVTDWLYMSLCRDRRPDRAARALQAIREDMDIIENQAYYERVLMYKGLKTPQDLLDPGEGALLRTTAAYGVGNWYLCDGRTAEARAVFERIVDDGYWPAFGYIAAEADLARMQDTE